MSKNTQHIKRLIRREAQHLFTIKSSPRPWHLVVTAALTMSLSIFLGAFYDQLPTGVLVSLGSMIILNQPAKGTVCQRQILLFVLGVIMVSSFSLGLVAQNVPHYRMPLFTLMTFTIVVLGRYLRLPPPAGMFILMASVIAIFMPVPWADMPYKIAAVAVGSIWAWIVALIYNVFVVQKVTAPIPQGYEQGLITESLIVTTFVVFALEVAVVFDMPYPYWVPVSSYIIMQGTHLRTMWVKQLHRILGTGIGVFVAWFLLSLSLSYTAIALVIFMMFIWIETMVVRHYALAVIMITPLTIFIAEYGRGDSSMVNAGVMAYQGIIQARFLDTIVGCGIALLGGVVMHAKWVTKPLMSLENSLFKKNS